MSEKSVKRRAAGAASTTAIVLGSLASLALLIFVLQNTASVTLSFIAWDFSFSAGLALLIAAGAGALIAIVAGAVLRIRHAIS